MVKHNGVTLNDQNTYIHIDDLKRFEQEQGLHDHKLSLQTETQAITEKTDSDTLTSSKQEDQSTSSLPHPLTDLNNKKQMAANQRIERIKPIVEDYIQKGRNDTEIAGFLRSNHKALVKSDKGVLLSARALQGDVAQIRKLLK